MAVVSFRLNKNEENIMNFLANYYGEDKTSLIKHSLKEMYEDLMDNNTIDEYEIKEETGKTVFVSAEEIIESATKQRNTDRVHASG
ncbi:hypothetical protein AGMMS50212_09450 [Spirochaetia bacterium]|nr:hypothetical protein AGMMS50212_09450 [Spirochaetia bacterium]